MALPLLDYKPSSQNQRVEGYLVPGDEQPRIYSSEDITGPTDMDALIEAAYQQMFFYAFKWDREPILESQLRFGQITVRDFIRGLALSKTFYNSFYEKNSNYKFVEHCVQKILGREVYSDREKIAWSIKVATKGIAGFIDELLDSEDYIQNFGYTTVPYQRRRILPGRAEGERPIHISNPRYDAYHRNILGFPQIVWQTQVKRFVPQDKAPKEGSPVNFLGMARSIGATGAAPAQVSTGSINIATAVPYRKVSAE
ncbi:phycobilisome rod-core linker polypeptide CpcG [filamentous cyanobacterium CCP5]|nr:phycobilisome rod-core linker polypeptide CpcG [filamentous cyanobacterium CCP5]